ncbi:hypothetical protein [Actinobaculum suis]|uniref:hypothetical protein n=1 Tax=Actinobaculum suis TaxID=1657 RepID=UPI000809A80B|nr:hypothetical protein [Actinobaculum suis]OCA93478.1 hypothetical protein ACU20_01345 [Actinobaculum suis]
MPRVDTAGNLPQEEVLNAGTPVAFEVPVGTPTRTRWGRICDFFRSADGIASTVLWLFLFGFLAVTVLPGMTSSKVFGPTGLLQMADPWRWTLESEKDQIPNSGQWDVYDSVIPESIFITESARAGHYPQWNPNQVGGTEGGAVPNVALLSPLSLPWWIMPAAYAPAGVKICETIAVALGFFLLLRRRWKFANFTVPLATLMYMSSGFMLAWTGWPQTRVAAMLPLLLWSAEALVSRRKWTTSAWFGLVLASLLLGGFPAVAIYGLYLAGGFFLLRFVTEWQGIREALRTLARGLLGGMLGLGLSAIQMLPFLDFSRTYVDFETRQRGSGPLPKEDLATALDPSIFGVDFDLAKWPTHWVEGLSYIGATTLVLAAIGVLFAYTAKRGIASYFAIVAVLLLTGLYGEDIVTHWLLKMPFLASSFLGRVRVVMDLAFVVLAAIGAQTLYGGAPRWNEARERLQQRWYPRIRTIFAGAVIVYCGYQLRDSENLALEKLAEDYPSQVIQHGVTMGYVVGTLLAVLVIIALCVTSKEERTRALALAACGGLVAGPATATARTWWPQSSTESFYPPTATHDFLAANLGQDRFAPVSIAMLTGSQDAYNLRSMNGHKFTDPRYVEMLERIDPDGRLSATYSLTSWKGLRGAAEHGIYDRLAARYFVTGPEDLSLSVSGAVEDMEPVVSYALSSGGDTVTSEIQQGPLDALLIRSFGDEGLRQNNGISHLQITDLEGNLLAESRIPLDGMIDPMVLPIDGTAIPEDQMWQAQLSLEDTDAQATVGVNETGNLVSKPLSFMEELGMELAFYDGTFIFERPGALHRIRWADEQIVATDPQERLDIMDDPETPGEAVILESPDVVRAEPLGTGEITNIDTPNPDDTYITVRSNGPGWVVVAENLRHKGWQASLDGQSTEIVPAEYFAGAVFVPDAGEHVITLKYRNPYFEKGKWVSLLCLLGTLGILGGAAISKRKGKNK